MKITKFVQSCVLIESNREQILVDPGVIQYNPRLVKTDWTRTNIILVTHKHQDHCHEEAITHLVNNNQAKLYSSKEVAETYPNLPIQKVAAGETIDTGKNKIEVVRAVHGYMPFLKGAGEITENIGFIIDNGETRVYFTSDTICFPNNYKCDVVFVPVCNHGLVMDPFAAALFAKETGAKLTVPYHYDNPKFPTDIKEVERTFDKQELKYRVLEIGENLEI